jgi:YebC/PmpR family DNA-binding regulatory protein
MAGHSKWANIQHRKCAQDRKRGKICSKLIREIGFAARSGGSEPASNGRLRLAIDKARAVGVSPEAVEGALRRIQGRSVAEGLEPARFEGYGPGGAAVMVDCLTDNLTRTSVDVRDAFARNGGHLGAEGSVSYLFNLVGLMTFPPGTDVERLIQVALHAGAEDVIPNEDGSVEVLADPTEFDAVRAIIIAGGFIPATADVTQRASTPIRVSGESGEHMVRLLEALENLDDVQSVFSNVEISDEVLARV